MKINMANFTNLQSIKPTKMNFLETPLINPPEMSGNPFNNDKIDTIVLHWSAIDGVDNTLTELKRKGFSYHFLIDKTGNIYQLLELKRRGYHAGVSYGPGGVDVNSYSIGIAFTTESAEKDSNKETNQSCNELCSGDDNSFYGGCKNLILDLLRNQPDQDNKVEFSFITGHHMISPSRRVDPYYFPFDKLIKDVNNQLKFWRAGDGPRKSNGKPASDDSFKGAKRDNDGEPFLSEKSGGKMFLRYDDTTEAIQNALDERNLGKDDLDDEDLNFGGEGA